MKITKSQLKQIIREELEEAQVALGGSISFEAETVINRAREAGLDLSKMSPEDFSVNVTQLMWDSNMDSTAVEDRVREKLGLD